MEGEADSWDFGVGMRKLFFFYHYLFTSILNMNCFTSLEIKST